jgi:glucose/arabinose dehydrogenase
MRLTVTPCLFFLAVLLPGPTRATPPVDACKGVTPAKGTALRSELVVSGLSRPLFVTAPPGDVSRLFILEQDGRVRVFKDGALLSRPFLDLGSQTRSPGSGGGWEEGLLGMAFHPRYAENRLFYVYHTDSTGNHNLIVRYRTNPADPGAADPSSRRVIVTLNHPRHANHNGGMLAFAPDDGHLYAGTGDGGSMCDPGDNSQNPDSLLGKLLRINVDVDPVKVEVWALGLRNPWRFAFDQANSDLYIGDVGQGDWEEVDYYPAPRAKGANFGWDLYEGAHCPNPSCSGRKRCDSIRAAAPVLEYSHKGNACSITGGVVYRGCRMPDLRGTYFYADFCSEFIRSFRIQGGVAVDQKDRTQELSPGGKLRIEAITSFGEDARGEIYVVDQEGEIFRIVPAEAATSPGKP